MDLAKIDKNLVQVEAEVSDGVKRYKLPCSPFSVHGMYYNAEEERFLRLPAELSEKTSYGIGTLSRMLAGGRIIFSTDSDFLELSITAQDSEFRVSTMPTTGCAGFSLHEMQSKQWWMFDHNFIPTKEDKTGFTFTKKLRNGKLGEMRDYIIHTPIYADAKTITIGVNEKARVECNYHYRDIKPILYYGSSVTQGCCVSRPDMAYQAHIAKWNDIDFINLGFSGSAKGEPAMAEYLATIDCSLFVCAYDYNAESIEQLKETHYPLYKTFRGKHKDTPILFVTRADTDSTPDGVIKSKAVIFETYKRAVDEGDKNVYFLDGAEIYGKEDRDKCTIDDCHPNDLGAYYIAKALYKKFISIDEKFR